MNYAIHTPVKLSGHWYLLHFYCTHALNYKHSSSGARIGSAQTSSLNNDEKHGTLIALIFQLIVIYLLLTLTPLTIRVHP